MKFLVHTLIIVGGAAIGVGIGCALRKSGGHAAIPTIVALNSTTNAPLLAKASGPKRGPARDDSPLATKLEHDLALSTGVTRWLLWVEALEKAGPTDFPRLVRLAKGDPAALKFVATRWAQAAPRGMFDALVAGLGGAGGREIQDLARTLFNEWPKADPEAAIAALNEPSAGGFRDSWRHEVATTVIDQNAERGLQLFAEWHIENYGPRMNTVAKWADADPRHAAEFALQYPTGYASQLAMETIGKEWAKIDPAAALQFAGANPGSLGSSLANAVLKQWAGKDLNQATDWLSTADVPTRNQLAPAFVETWAKQDAANALAWCEQNLAGSRLAQAVGGVITGAADKDVAAAASLVTGMDPSSARAEGAAAVARKWFPDVMSDNGNNPISPEAISWLGNLDSDSLKRALDQVTWQWSTRDPKSMATFLSSLSSDQVPQWSDAILARQMVRQQPLDALNWANSLPPSRGLSAGADAYGEWRLSQPDAATDWLNTLPPNDARRQPYFESAIRSLAWSTQGTDQFAGLSASDRAIARNVVQGMTLPEERKTRVLGALTGP